MALTKASIRLVSEALQWAQGSYTAAAGGVCPSAAAAYLELYNALKEGRFGTGELVAGTKVAWDVALNYADQACKSASDYRSSSGLTPTPDVTPPKPVLAGLGSSWWLWLVGGGLLFLLFGKKSRT